MIELRVEDYCQICPDFEAEVFKNYGGRIGYTVVCCKYAKRCEQMAERLKKVYDDTDAQKAVRDDRVAPVKSMELCMRCMYNSLDGDLCHGKDCDSCRMTRLGISDCYCLQLKDGQPCLHFKKQED